LRLPDAADKVIRGAPRELVDEMRAASFEGMFERSHHRDRHLTEIEAALGSA